MTQTIKQINLLTIEQFDAMALQELEAVATVLGTSTTKKSRLQLDQVKIIIEKRIKQAKKSGNAEELNDLKQVENSVKRTVRPKKKQAEEVQAELDLDETPEEPKKATPKKPKATPKKPKVAEQEPKEAKSDEQLKAEIKADLESKTLADIKAIAKALGGLDFPKTITKSKLIEKILELPLPLDPSFKKEDADKKPTPTPKKAENKSEAQDVKALKAELEALRKENATLKMELFPKEFESKGGATYSQFDMKTIGDLQKSLLETPLQLYAQIHEGIDDVATTMLLTYVNDNIILLVDKSRQIDSTLTLYCKEANFKNGDRMTVKIDGKDCPIRFYLRQPK